MGSTVVLCLGVFVAAAVTPAIINGIRHGLGFPAINAIMAAFGAALIVGAAITKAGL